LQTISEVLTDCGSDIDAAIKRLGQLQLRAEGKSSAAQDSASAAATQSSVSPREGAALHQHPKPFTAVPSCIQRDQLYSFSAGPIVLDCFQGSLVFLCTDAAAAHASQSAAAEGSLATAAATAAASAATQQQPPHQQQAKQPATSEEWVDALVQTMSQATDMADARARAAQALQAFEQAVTAQVWSCVQAVRIEDALQMLLYQIRLCKPSNGPFACACKQGSAATLHATSSM
jgi:chemotaxis protein histidine kinase CheA